MSYNEGTNYQANRQDKGLPMFDKIQENPSDLELNRWYKMDNFSTKQRFNCLVKFNTIDAGNEFRLMTFDGSIWYDYYSKERRFENRVTEFIPIEFI